MRLFAIVPGVYVTTFSGGITPQELPIFADFFRFLAGYQFLPFFTAGNGLPFPAVFNVKVCLYLCIET